MSLQVWLPLNGNLNNQGISDVSITNSGAVINSDGKIGSCYSFGTDSSKLSLSTNVFTNISSDFSVACWVKIITWNTSYATIWAATSTSVSWNQIIAGMFRNGSSSKILFCISNGSSSTQAGCLTSNDINLNEWNHFVCTYTSGIIKLYQNGELVSSLSTSIIPAFSSTQMFDIGKMRDTYQSNTYLNDFRIYNHCLSQMEVRELAQGLVVHYPLRDSAIESTTNLCTSGTLGSNCYNGATSKYNYGTNTDIYKITGFFQNKQCTKVYIGTSGQSAYPYVWFDNLHPSNGGYKTLSFNYYPTSQTSLIFYTYNGSATASYTVNGSAITSGSSIPVELNKWNHITLTLLGTSDNTSGWGYVRIGTASHTSTTTEYWLFADIQIEEKDHATMYTSSSRTTDNIVYDCSGFENNGTASGNILLSNDSHRNLYSYSLSDSASTILLGNLSTMVPDGIFTFNIWFKKKTDEWSTKNWETIFGGPGGFELEMKSSSTNTPVVYQYSWGKANFAYNLDKWNMLTMVRTSSDSKFYLNGELKNTGSAGFIPSGNYYIGSWSNATSQNYRGLLSDARIYATALSESDILSLYNNGISIDENEQIHAYEFEEV